jgi:GxxExxY protein
MDVPSAGPGSFETMLFDAASTVLGTLGVGLRELVYHKAMEVELTARGFGVNFKKALNIVYKGKIVGTVEPDLIVMHEDKEFVVELKIENISAKDEAQLRNYMRLTCTCIGYLISFNVAKGLISKTVEL